MKCQEYRTELIEWARGEEPRASLLVHVSSCPECAQFLEAQQALTTALDTVAADAIPSATQIQARVMAEFDRHARTAKARVFGWCMAGALAAAAALFATVTPPKPAPLPAAFDASQFVPIPYTVPLTPEERATVVRMEIPVSALIAAGFRMPPMDPGATVQADVLVSQDGRARAIRPLSISSSN